MEEKYVPVFYDDQLIPNQDIKIIKNIAVDIWFADYNSLLNLQSKLPSIITDYKGLHHTQAFSDKVCLYSK